MSPFSKCHRSHIINPISTCQHKGRIVPVVMGRHQWQQVMILQHYFYTHTRLSLAALCLNDFLLCIRDFCLNCTKLAVEWWAHVFWGGMEPCMQNVFTGKNSMYPQHLHEASRPSCSSWTKGFCKLIHLQGSLPGLAGFLFRQVPVQCLWTLLGNSHEKIKRFNLLNAFFLFFFLDWRDPVKSAVHFSFNLTLKPLTGMENELVMYEL